MSTSNVRAASSNQRKVDARTSEGYKAKYGTSNPNVALVRELKEAGVKVTVCGQSLRGRGVENDQVLSEVEVATSMLTTVTSYQVMGYQLLRF